MDTVVYADLASIQIKQSSSKTPSRKWQKIDKGDNLLCLHTDIHHLNFSTSSFRVLRPSLMAPHINEEMEGVGRPTFGHKLYIHLRLLFLTFTVWCPLTEGTTYVGGNLHCLPQDNI